MKSLFLAILFFPSPIAAFAASSPTLYFTDLQYAPPGAIVTVYGSNLNSTVQVNGVSATVVATGTSHSGYLQTVSIVVPNTTSGNIGMSGSNNTLPLTIQPMNVYWVSTSGNDSNSGSQSSPWATLAHAIHAVACNSIIYAMDGVSQTGVDNYNASLAVDTACTQTTPIALVGYPGATVTVGSATGQEYGIRSPDLSTNDWNGVVFANLVVRGNNTAFNFTGDQYWRIVDTDDSCPSGSGEAACILIDASSNVEILGNYVHDSGAGGTKYYHSIYGTTNTINAEVAWNYIYNNHSCRGVQFYSTSGSPQYNLSVHDNIIDGQLCDGINFSTIDANLGYIKAYNNLIFNVGQGDPSTLGSPNMACIASLGYGNPGGTAYFYGNTMANCGSGGGSTAGAITVQSGSPMVDLDSNLVMQNSGEVIYSPNNNASLVTASNNVLLTSGTAGVVNSSYQLVAGSPAIGAGIAMSGILYDLAGNPRPQSGSEDAGAYLFNSSSSGGPTAALSASTLSFGNQAIGTTSSAQSVTLSNSGNADLSISSIALGGTDANQFSSSNNCSASLPTGQSCMIQVQFDPSSAGSMTGTITIDTNASNPTESISLSGTGTTGSPAAVKLAPTSISFGNQTVNTTSVAQTVTMTNSGGATLNITGVALTGANSSAFHSSNSCGSTLASGASCSIQVTFAPTASGAMSAAVSLTDSASNSPQSVALSGTGTSSAPAAVTLAPTSISFGNQTVNTTSAVQTVTLTNSGGATLNITAVALTGANSSAFQISNGCGSTLASGASCTIHITFAPSASGAMSASVSLTDSASNSPQSVALSGTGTAQTTPSTSVNLSPTSLTFTSEPTGATSAAQTVTLSNSGTVAVSITSIAVSGDFAAMNTCGTAVAAGASCTISVTFTPTASGSLSGTLTATDSAPGSPQTVTLSGTGTSISVTSTSPTLTVGSAGGSTTDGIQLQSVDGFSGIVNLTCAVASEGASTLATAPTCSLSPAQGQLSSGTTAAASTLTINASRASSATRFAVNWLHSGTLVCLVLVGFVPRRRKCQLGLWIVLGIIAIGTVGCGGITMTNKGAALSYSVVVKATSGTVSSSVTIPVTVQ